MYICESPNKAGGLMPFDLNASAKKAARPPLVQRDCPIAYQGHKRVCGSLHREVSESMVLVTRVGWLRTGGPQSFFFHLGKGKTWTRIFWNSHGLVRKRGPKHKRSLSVVILGALGHC